MAHFEGSAMILHRMQATGNQKLRTFESSESNLARPLPFVRSARRRNVPRVLISMFYCFNDGFEFASTSVSNSTRLIRSQFNGYEKRCQLILFWIDASLEFNSDVRISFNAFPKVVTADATFWCDTSLFPCSFAFHLTSVSNWIRSFRTQFDGLNTGGGQYHFLIWCFVASMFFRVQFDACFELDSVVSIQ